MARRPSGGGPRSARSAGRKAVPVREWMAAQRERILAHGDGDGGGDFGAHVRRMYAESMRLSDRWAAEFRSFWELPEDFDFGVPTPTVDISKAMLAAAAAQEGQS